LAFRLASIGKICQVKVRELSRKDNPDEFASGDLEDGTKFLIDRRAAIRLPSRFGLTVRGLGRLKHLDLDLEGEQWGTLLYDWVPVLAIAPALALSPESRDRCLAIALGHVDVTSGVIGDVGVVLLMPPAQRKRRELGASHVRLQLLQR
jgi:hypothetical protein